MIKQGLQFKFTQQLAMTPQLQQAIKLLQLSTPELLQELQLAIESNPLLEQVDLNPEIEAEEYAESVTLDSREALEQRNMPQELPLDANWDAFYTAGTPSGTGFDYQGEELPIFQGETTQTLQDYLMWQVGLTPFSDQDRVIATALVDAIDDTGYLTVSLEDILESLGNKDICLDEVTAVLKRVQHFDPLGVGARTLKECLLVQLSQYPLETPMLAEAQLIIDKHLALLASHDYRGLTRVMKINESSLKTAITLIQSLDPRPGESFNQGETDYIIPDVLVRKVNKQWSAELNSECLPRIQVHQHYASLAVCTTSESDNQFIRTNLQAAKWLIRSLESRNETLLKVAHCIVERQQEFFELGEEYMRPMILADIAQTIGIHESTVSRVTTQKFLHSPRGLVELKYFFSSHVSTQNGGEASSIAIRALIKKLIAGEDTARPLSDSKLTHLLANQGIIVARRTVAKYREALSIPPSNQRKQLR